ncbi:MAG: transketolase [Candidatus Kapabacteria bacterium]|nr:transketolase [Candidatus Kapabacteria bacterium]
MRNEFCAAIANVMSESTTTFFLTGDLGFNALEGIQQLAGSRFINAGVAEQSMIGIAAGIASCGNDAFVYSIAPFATFRCIEQIRIDVCIHDLPVYIVGNGGGYGYGIMGATHHAIEDIGCMSTLYNMTCWIPAFADDVRYCIDSMRAERKPAYLRLGMGRPRPAASVCGPASPVTLASDPKVTVVTLGPIIANVLDALERVGSDVPADVFSVIRIPLDEADIARIAASVEASGRLIVVEEHVARGGLSEYLIARLHDMGLDGFRCSRLCAAGYPNKLYGSQRYHQAQSGLDADRIAAALRRTQ